MTEKSPLAIIIKTTFPQTFPTDSNGKEVQDKQIKFVEENGPKPIEDILLPNSHEDLAALDSKRNRFFDAQDHWVLISDV